MMETLLRWVKLLELYTALDWITHGEHPRLAGRQVNLRSWLRNESHVPARHAFCLGDASLVEVLRWGCILT